MILEYFCTRNNVIKPTRANPDEEDLRGIYIEPGESRLFSTGLKFGIPHGYMLEVKNRSGNASKLNLLVGACVIDSGYNGEVFVNLHNVGGQSRFVERGMKIAQIVMVPVVHFRALETGKDNLYDWHPITISNRGTGALGSTDKTSRVSSLTTKDVDPYLLPPSWEIGDQA